MNPATIELYRKYRHLCRQYTYTAEKAWHMVVKATYHNALDAYSPERIDAIDSRWKHGLKIARRGILRTF